MATFTYFVPVLVAMALIFVGTSTLSHVGGVALTLVLAERALIGGSSRSGVLERKVSRMTARRPPSRSEGMGNLFVEALAASLPVIATQEGGLSDFIFDEKRDHAHEMTAWAVDPDAPDQIADAVKRIIDNPPKTVRVTVHNRSWDWATARGSLADASSPSTPDGNVTSKAILMPVNRLPSSSRILSARAETSKDSGSTRLPVR